MKLHRALLLAALVPFVSQAAPADDVKAAAKKLADAPNYAWTRTTEIANSQFPAMPAEGATEKGGYTVTKVTFNENSFLTVRKGEQSVSQDREGNWLTSEERRAQFANRGGGEGSSKTGGSSGGGRSGRGGFTGGMMGGGQMNPAEELAALAGQAKNFKSADGALVAELDEAAVAQRLSLGGTRGGGDSRPAPKNVSGSLKVWLKGGVVSKYQVHIKGTVAGRDGEAERELTTTTEVRNIGSAKVEVPEAAKKKLGA